MSNYDLFISTIEVLKNSQGFYGRIANYIDNMSDDERATLKNKLNNMSVQFKDSTDVVMYLET